MTQFGPFTLGIVALFLFLIISVSANKKELPEDIVVTKMSLGEYCNFFKKPFCSLPNLEVEIGVTTSDIDDTCAEKLIEKAKKEYGETIIGVFNFGINSYPQESENRFRYLETKVICSADVVFFKHKSNVVFLK